MPKMKTRRAAAKRFTKTGTGKIKRNHAYMNHMLEHKQKKTKRKLRKTALLHKADVKRVKHLIGNK